MSYVDGFVAAVPTADRATYKDYAEKMAVKFKECGATEVVDCWGDDVPDGEVTSFPMAVAKKDDETVAFGWIIWPSKEAHEAGWEKVMQDPAMQQGAAPMPFDGKRMIYGRFQVLTGR